MMNTEEIVQVLKNHSDLSDYEYTKVTKNASELFFVKKKMELNRVVNTDTVSIVVYKDVDDKRGSSMIAVTSADDADSLNSKITAAVKKAETVSSVTIHKEGISIELCDSISDEFLERIIKAVSNA